jgi:hypothetical protein
LVSLDSQFLRLSSDGILQTLKFVEPLLFI